MPAQHPHALVAWSDHGALGNWACGSDNWPRNPQAAGVQDLGLLVAIGVAKVAPTRAVTLTKLPIIRNNALVPRPGSSATRLPCRRRSGSWPTLDLHYGVRQDGPHGNVFTFRIGLHPFPELAVVSAPQNLDQH